MGVEIEGVGGVRMVMEGGVDGVVDVEDRWERKKDGGECVGSGCWGRAGAFGELGWGFVD